MKEKRLKINAEKGKTEEDRKRRVLKGGSKNFYYEENYQKQGKGNF